ncbi:insulin-like growth factor-binding protein complex acid labile subunit [Mercenaria mercenaria]|uniref:insulin-like growth factor-binding protein complex acid labile subunit n=1 Tax=Mercenaria mercenaria TaxID=6596 RepID=UPI00234F39FC|nr:insulin-like growth factor-binding protein complex acid labile subunit [Mercenaria mercenaria]XP_045207671.2 insulin-like growth factor-binding protein complex acid labile subunit [Mercenaria mercenaria]XP_045207676.2 insulin-like growth factor-binding protein complex acid labile subunit [Mercenaria mercenaria]
MVKLKGCNSVCLVVIFLSCCMTGGVACPDICTCAERLYIYCDHGNMTDEDLVPVLENIPTETMYIDLSYNSLTFIPENAFQKFSALIYVDLSHNEIRNISENVFRHLKNLQKIFLHHNALTRLKNRTFTEMPLLKEVHVYNNNISAIELCAFINTPKLEKFLMQHNQMKSFSNRTFKSLETLSYLDLSENGMQTINKYAFSKLVSLRTLILSRNNISKLYLHSFSGLTSLQTLDLNENHIEDLDGFIFNPFRDTIRTILLKRNKLKLIRSDLFYSMRSLAKLDLSFNEISALGSRMFLGVGLEELCLRGNDLTEITAEIFVGATKINVLDVSHNKLTDIHIGAFNSFSENIYEISMERNFLTRLLAGVFKGMRFLQSAKMANNSISYIEDGTFRDLVNLKKLDLSWNKLSMVTLKMLEGLASVKSLDLHYNPLVRFEFPEFSKAQGTIEINMNLTVSDVSHDTADIKWPYTAGSQIYWSREVMCIEVEQCTFRPQPEFLAPYETELVLKNLQPDSLYYICVNPAFRSSQIKLHQCLHVRTDKVKIETTVPVITVSERAISASTECVFEVAALLCSFFVYIVLL